jgi:hypothetical protein
MIRATRSLRLGRLPRTESVKLTISVTAELKESIDAYAAAHSRLHGETVDALTLIPHMLNAFIQRDRGFKAITKKRNALESVSAASAAQVSDHRA